MRKTGTVKGPGEVIRGGEGGGTPGSHTHQRKHSRSQHGIHCVQPGHLWSRQREGLGRWGPRGREEGLVQRPSNRRP